MADVNGMRTGFVLDKDGNRILPITHMSLIIGDDGKTILGSLEEVREAANQATEAVSEVDQRFEAVHEQIEGVGQQITDANAIISNVDNRIASVQSFENLPTNDSLIDGAIRYVINDKKYYSYTTAEGWKEMVTSGDGSGGDHGDDPYSHIWIGEEPPEDSNMVWIDTTSDGIVEGADDVSLLYQLMEKFAQMQNEINTLKKRVKYLEENGVFVPDDEDPDKPGVEDEPDYILFEDGSELLLEDDSGGVLLEVQIDDSDVEEEDEDDIILFEDGTDILLEDGTSLLLEVQEYNPKPSKPSIKENIILYEDGTEILYEDNTNILLEMQ